MKKIGLVSLFASLILLAGCGSAPGESKLITNEGAGSIRITDTRPDVKAPYTATLEENEMDGYSYWAVTDGEGNTVLEYEPGQNMTVYSHEYKTETGLHAGMRLDKALEILTEAGIVPRLEYDRGGFGFTVPVNDHIGLVIGLFHLKDFDQWWLGSGDASKLDFNDFTDDATVMAVIIRK